MNKIFTQILFATIFASVIFVGCINPSDSGSGGKHHFDDSDSFWGVRLEGEGGYIPSEKSQFCTSTEVSVQHGHAFEDIEKYTPHKNYYEFEGWHLDTADGRLWTKDDIVTGPVKLVAKWKYNPIGSLDAPQNMRFYDCVDYFKIAWDEVENANKYSVYLKKSTDKEAKCIDTVNTTYYSISKDNRDYNFSKGVSAYVIAQPSSIAYVKSVPSEIIGLGSTVQLEFNFTSDVNVRTMQMEQTKRTLQINFYKNTDGNFSTADTELFKTVEVNSKKPLKYPDHKELQAKENAIFTGWYTKKLGFSEETQLFDFSKDLKDDVNLFAKWYDNKMTSANWIPDISKHTTANNEFTSKIKNYTKPDDLYFCPIKDEDFTILFRGRGIKVKLNPSNNPYDTKTITLTADSRFYEKPDDDTDTGTSEYQSYITNSITVKDAKAGELYHLTYERTVGINTTALYMYFSGAVPTDGATPNLDRATFKTESTSPANVVFGSEITLSSSNENFGGWYNGATLVSSEPEFKFILNDKCEYVEKAGDAYTIKLQAQ